MPLTLVERKVDNLQHARWRVKFVESLLSAHRTAIKRCPEWAREEGELLNWLAAARQERDSAERDLASRVPEQEAC